MITDLAQQPPRIITNPGPEFADDVRQFQGIPGIDCTPGGRLWAAWYSGGDWEGPENYLILVTSNDGGETWSDPTFIIDPVAPNVRAFDPCLWLDPQERLWLFWSQSLGSLDGRFGVWAMFTENADTELPDWSEPRRIGDGIMMNKPTVAANGDWLLPISIWKPHQPHQPPDYFHLEERTGAWVVISSDSGKTFEYIGMANRQENRIYDEHMLVERRSGSWWMLTRTRKGIWENESQNGGKTWNAGRASDIPHLNSRFFIRRLISGNLLLVRHPLPNDVLDPEKAPRARLTAFLSEDDGVTWFGGLLLDERLGVSYPDGTQMPDGTIHVIYDWNRTTDKHILLATFTEEDVRAGTWISPHARPRHLINQATAEGKDGPATLVLDSN